MTRLRFRMMLGFGLVLSLWLSACSSPLGMGGGGPVRTGVAPADLLARRAVPLIPTSTPRPTVTITPAPDLAATQTATAGVLEPVVIYVDPPTETPTSPPAFRICSPLVNILREDLPRILSDGYHPPPRSRPDDRHEGVDIAYYHWKGLGPIAGTGVQSVLAGRVAMALEDTFPYGNVVMVETANADLPEELRSALNIPPGQSLYLLYAHMEDDSLQVSLGAPVASCQVVGAVGRTGNTDAYHLHLETRLGPPGASFSGMSAFTNTATEAEKSNYRLWRISGKYNHFDPMSLLLYGVEGVVVPSKPTAPPKEKD